MKKNTYDKYIEEVSKTLLQVPNFEKIEQDPQMQKIFDSLYAKMVEVSNLRELYEKYYCPAARECIRKQTKLIQKSKYLKGNNEALEKLQDIYYSTIRMGYVQLFHYVESYVNVSLFPQLNIICQDSDIKTVQWYCTTNYNYNIEKHWKQPLDFTIEKINWITRRVKHNDGFPINEHNKWPTHYLLKNHEFRFEESKRFQIEIDEFIQDINDTLDFLSRFTTIVFK
ncbi:MAG: hypothetical protein LUF90_08990, partial [Rikenellaceae bacterium]|nr:hypothetical protein [Rikenellaceae bacterium]